MNAGGARHLRDSRDGHLHIRRRHQHQVRQLIDDHHDVAQLLGDDDVLLARHHDFLVDFDRETLRARLDLLLAWPSAAAPVPGGGSGLFLGRELNEPMLRTPTRAKIW